MQLSACGELSSPSCSDGQTPVHARRLAFCGGAFWDARVLAAETNHLLIKKNSNKRANMEGRGGPLADD